MAAMQQIEHAIGEADDQALRPPGAHAVIKRSRHAVRREQGEAASVAGQWSRRGARTILITIIISWHNDVKTEGTTMPSSVALGNLEGTVKRLVESGRYNSRSEVLREGVRLVEEREKALAALDAALERGLADADAGRVHDADDVFGKLKARYAAMAGGSLEE